MTKLSIQRPRDLLAQAYASLTQNLADAGMTLKGPKTPQQQRSIVFVLGGPGSGKGTQAQTPTSPRGQRALRVLHCANPSSMRRDRGQRLADNTAP